MRLIINHVNENKKWKKNYGKQSKYSYIKNAINSNNTNDDFYIIK